MKRISTWSPALAVLAFVLLAAAPGKRPTSVQTEKVAVPTQGVVPSETQISSPVGEETTNRSVTPEEAATTTPAVSASVPAATYAIDWYSINGGGTVNSASTNYKMGASIGQSVAGAASSASYQMGIGFWYGAGAAGTCACDCHGDPACDMATDILDVVQLVNVAFRGFASILDPNVNCPYETTDVDCSLATDVLDVVRMVNVAFRGFDAATEFCNPCP